MQGYKKELRRRIQEFLDSLETEGEGHIKRNLAKINEFESLMDKYFDDEMIAYLTYMVGAIRSVLRKSAENFSEDGAKYEDVKFFEQYLGVRANKVIPERQGHATVLFAAASMTAIRVDIVEKLQRAMISDTFLSDFKKAVDVSVSRRFHDYFEINSVAAIFNTYNSANHFFAKKYNYTKFRYEGGIISESRDFCIERNGLEFNIEDGRSWNDLDWKGKIPGVDFFVQCGGYNCRHWITYIK